MPPFDRQRPVSIVIPVRDGAKYLQACLQAIAGSKAAPAEVIVVDDGSLDDSASIAKQHGAQVLSMGKSHGPASARNAGSAIATQPFLMFLDADVIVHDDTLDRAFEAITGPESPCAVFGAYDDRPMAPGVVSQYRNLLHHFTHSTGERNAKTFWAGCGIIRREVFLQYGGFDESYRRASVEDIELGMRMRRSGAKILLLPEVQVCHAKEWRLLSLIRTDVMNRAWPWSLLLQAGRLPDDLNLRWSQRWSGVMACLLVVFIAIAFVFPIGLVGAFASAAGIAICNRAFLGFLARKRGRFFVARAFPLHVLYFLYSSVTFAVAVVLQVFSRTLEFCRLY